MLTRETNGPAAHAAETPAVRLLHAEADEVGAHSGHQYSRALRRGELLRLRSGVYVRTEDWMEALASQRHRLVIGAVAMKDPATVFCRESALHLYGLSQRQLPREVTVRTVHPSLVGRRAPPPLTGDASAARFLRRAEPTRPEQVRSSKTHLANVPTRRSEAPLPPGVSRPEFRRLGDVSQVCPAQTLPPDALDGVRGPAGYRIELLGLVLVDMVPRMEFSEAVILLDAVRRRGNEDAESWLPWLGGGIRRRRWDRAWEFSDATAESVGESYSRAVLHELGAPPPQLQRPFSTGRGGVRVDFCWPEFGVIGEFDGREKYLDPTMLRGRDPKLVHLDEKDREDELRSMGWIVVRWGWQDLRDPQRLIGRLRRAGLPV